MDPLNREIEVLVGPLPDWRGGGDRDQAARFFSDGTAEQLRIKFNIQKHMVSTASPSTVSFYNLSAELRNALTRRGAQVVVSAGWRNTGRTQIFSGGLLNAVSHRQGPDIVTNISFLAGYGARTRALSSKTFNAGTALSGLIADLAGELPGVVVDRKLIKIRSFAVSAQGLSLIGSTSDALDKLARAYGFSWWVDQGTFHAVDDLDVLDGGATSVTSKNGFLIRAEPTLSSPYQQQAGVTVRSLFNPLIDVGRVLRVESDLNPGITGDYKVHSLTHAGDSHASMWETSVESFTYGL